MQIIENNKIKEKVYTEKLNNGLMVMVIPKKVRKKYIIWGTKFGSIDNKFVLSGESTPTVVPDGIAHYLEHKMFEQENGRNSLDVLSSLGVNANAYTTNNHTAYLFECTDCFYEALDEFMNYIQNPYFTDENVEKERGIIGQEIMMYEDYPDWALYMNAIKCMYHKNEVSIDVAGTKETIAEINKEKLYKIYRAFYRPDNMVMIIAGNFEPEEIIEEIKKRMKMTESQQTVKRIYENEPETIVSKKIERQMDISMPCFIVGYKDNDLESNKVKKSIAIDIIGNIILGRSARLFQKLYEKGKILSEPSWNYEFAETYAHVLIQGQTNYVDDVIAEISFEVERVKKEGIKEEDFQRIKKKIYGEMVKDYNEVATIANGFVANYVRGINSFDYFEEFESIHKTYVEKVLRDVLQEEKKVISVIKPNTNIMASKNK